jgi:hypothetical protein
MSFGARLAVFFKVAFRVLAAATMLVIVAGAVIWFVSFRRTTALEGQAGVLKTWTPKTLHIADGAMTVSLATRCKESQLDFRVQFLPVEKIPTEIPAWLRMSAPALLQAAESESQSGAGQFWQPIDVANVGFTVFPASIPANKVVRLALLQAARHGITTFGIALKDQDGFALYDLEVVTFTRLVGDIGQVDEAYEYESRLFCNAEHYQRAASWDVSWKE